MEGVQGRTRQSASTQLGERVRQLRVAAGQTQTDLAGNRFSKEYISQIERGKTRPTQDTIDWLAAQLKTDAGYLEHGVETIQLARAEAMLSQAEALAASKRHEEAAEAFAGAQSVVAATGLSELEFRRGTGEAWSRLERGGGGGGGAEAAGGGAGRRGGRRRGASPRPGASSTSSGPSTCTASAWRARSSAARTS